MARRFYPWDDWLDGRPRILSHGVHFTCSPEIFQKQLQAELRRREMAPPMRTRRHGGDVRIIVRPRRNSPYPWDEWLDGEIHFLQRGRDFECNHNVFIDQARNAAKARGKRVRTRTRGDSLTGYREVALKAVPR